MSKTLTIVMYHYVRPIKDSPWPRIKGLELSDFKGQLDYIQKHYNIVSARDVIAAARGAKPLPARPLLLTFDDGYSDHFEHVFPLLKARGLSGAFFPPVRAVVERKMLGVNKIHFVLAANEHLGEVIAAIDGEIALAQGLAELKTIAEYRAEYAKPSRHDTADTMYVKNLLQFALPLSLREKLVDMLFSRHVSRDEKAFAAQFYMSENQLKTMIEEGMEVGSHGYAHPWLNSISEDAQAKDIDASLDVLKRLGALKEHFLFCYPYGAYNASTLKLLEKRGCAAAFTTVVSLAQLNSASLLELPRIDTNDLPREGNAALANWTKDAV